MKSYDPQMHSAEHILNQTMIRMFNCERSFSSHIEKKNQSAITIFNRPLDLDEEHELAQKVNEVISNILM